MNRRLLLKGLSFASLAGIAAVPAASSMFPASATVSQALMSAVPASIQNQQTTFPNPVLTTHHGVQVRFYDDLVRGKLVMLNFMFVGCGDICPGMTANLVRVQKLLGERMGRDIFMYSITLAPEHDTPFVLKSYAEGYRAKTGWTFLTGVPGDIEQLRKDLGFTDSDPVADADKTQHLGLVVMGNDTLDRWIKCPAMLRPERIVKTLGYLDSVPTAKGA